MTIMCMQFRVFAYMYICPTMSYIPPVICQFIGPYSVDSVSLVLEVHNYKSSGRGMYVAW